MESHPYESIDAVPNRKSRRKFALCGVLAVIFFFLIIPKFFSPKLSPETNLELAPPSPCEDPNYTKNVLKTLAEAPVGGLFWKHGKQKYEGSDVTIVGENPQAYVVFDSLWEIGVFDVSRFGEFAVT